MRLTWIKAFAASRTAPLRRRPRLNAGMTGPVGGMYMARETAVSQRDETAAFVKQDQRKAVPHGRFSGFHDSIHRKQLVFDTNRAWCTKRRDWIVRALFRKRLLAPDRLQCRGGLNLAVFQIEADAFV